MPPGGTFNQYETEGSFSVIGGGALRVHSPNGTSTVYSPNWWIKVEEDPECIQEEEHAEETTNDRPS